LAEVDQPRSLRTWIDLPIRFGRIGGDGVVEGARTGKAIV